MQTDLRLLLLIIGLVFGAYVLFNALTKRRFKAPAHLRNEFEQAILDATHVGSKKNRDIHLGESDPLLDDFISSRKDPATPHKKPARQNDLPIITQDNDDEKSVVEKSVTEMVILSILPKSTTGFEGHTLLAALRANHFHYGKQRIFHRHVNDNPTQPILYSVASLIEPGVFDRHDMANDIFPGIIMWSLLPQHASSQNTFEQLLTSARQLAASLNGVLCDDKRKPISTHVIAQYRVKIRELDRQYPNEFEH